MKRRGSFGGKVMRRNEGRRRNSVDCSGTFINLFLTPPSSQRHSTWVGLCRPLAARKDLPTKQPPPLRPGLSSVALIVALIVAGRSSPSPLGLACLAKDTSTSWRDVSLKLKRE
jgi:hypothetical protein